MSPTLPLIMPTIISAALAHIIVHAAFAAFIACCAWPWPLCAVAAYASLRPRFAARCFWGTADTFAQLRGLIDPLAGASPGGGAIAPGGEGRPESVRFKAFGTCP
jgi:hypothetical protein